MKRKIIRILIADDHDLIRQGLRRIISFEEDLDIVGESENGEEVVNMLKISKPDVVVLDFNMPCMNGIEALQVIKEQEKGIKVIMLTVENDRKTIHSAIDIGADGYILKESAGIEIVDAIRMVYKGEKYIDKSLVSLLFSDIKGKNKNIVSILNSLSKREVQVLANISKGFSNKEIGEKLYLSEKTIKNYATSLFKKINACDRVQATIFAINNNIDEYYESKFEK
ncbi:response regulator [Clostridium thailandense]|uniref:Response regulator transcription factor n=1 Tax=Clostridium thailandense TaxID=2794346 RepID=A0A949TGV2_9CLOT|nr:response regulator transcription factor [Clostridium thailandense]MBV7271980.1 response regulator transcription factor [Clostridium thailandense]